MAEYNEHGAWQAYDAQMRAEELIREKGGAHNAAQALVETLGNPAIAPYERAVNTRIAKAVLDMLPPSGSQEILKNAIDEATPGRGRGR